MFGSFMSWVSNRSVTCHGKGVESEDARDGARCQELVVWSLAGELDHGSLECADDGEREGSGRRAMRDRFCVAPSVDEADAVRDEQLVAALDLTPDGMVLARELQPQRDRHGRDVAPAEDGVTAG